MPQWGVQVGSTELAKNQPASGCKNNKVMDNLGAISKLVKAAGQQQSVDTYDLHAHTRAWNPVKWTTNQNSFVVNRRLGGHTLRGTTCGKAEASNLARAKQRLSIAAAGSRTSLEFQCLDLDFMNKEEWLTHQIIWRWDKSVPMTIKSQTNIDKSWLAPCRLKSFRALARVWCSDLRPQQS